MLERFFISPPNSFGILKISSCFKTFGQFENFFAQKFRADYEGEKTSFVTAHHPRFSLIVLKSLCWVEQHQDKCLAPLKGLATLGQRSCSIKPNVRHSQDKCPTPRKQMSYTLKTMTLGQIVIAPSHWTKNFCVFDANTYLK